MRFKNVALPAVLFVLAALLITYSPTSSARGWSGNAAEASAPNAGIADLQWQTVVNNSFTIPEGNTNFSSYSQPAVNSQGMIVFRARSTGGQRETGIFLRKGINGKVIKIADLNTLVPYPNNLNAEYLEFSAIARIAPNSDHTAFVGLHKPVYLYTLPDGSETRAGTAGIYTLLEDGLLVTGASKLGLVPDFDYFAVPGHKAPFDIFPGSPAVTDNGTIVYKGNYQIDGVGKTGIFYRRLLNTPGGGTEPAEMIANSDMSIPGLPPSAGYMDVKFGSTAPPSAYGDKLVFLGLDNEDDPHFGGIFLAEIKGGAPLTNLVGIGSSPPNVNVKIPALRTIGEGLSFDGSYLGFWASWGDEMKTIRLYCPADGNPDIITYCNGVDPLSVYDEESDRWYQEKEVPANQGIFMYDLMAERTYLVSKADTDFADFVFWVYSGKVPGSGPEIDAEPPRWRSATFLAVSNGQVVFKARTGYLGKNNEYWNPVDGLYLSDPENANPLEPIAVMGMDGALFDSNLAPGTMPVTGVGIEREGFRGSKLVVALSMANDDEGWGGIYVTTLRGRQPQQLVPEREEKPAPSLKKTVKR